MRSSVLLPQRGPPTTATWPAAPVRLSVIVSRRCSRGRSTVPSGMTSPATCAPLRRGQAELGVLDQVGHELVEGVGDVERRQPDLVGRRALADHPVDGDVEQRRLLALLLRPPASRPRASVSIGSSACTSEIVNGRMPRTRRPRRGATRARLDGGPETYAALNRSSVDWSGLR